MNLFDQDQRNQVVATFISLVDALLEDEQQNCSSAGLTREHGIYQWRRAIAEAGVDPGHPSQEPWDTLECKLAEIWQEVLNIPQVGIHDNFFELGGNSFMAVRMFSRVQRELGKNLPISTLLEASTVESLAQRVRERSGEWTYLKMIQQGEKRPVFYCVPGAGNSMLPLMNLAKYMGSDQPLFSFQMRGVNGEDDHFESIEQIAEKYVSAITTFQPEDPYFLGGYSFGGMVAYEMAQQMLNRDLYVAYLGIIDTPAQNPRFRYLYKLTWIIGYLLKLSPDKHREIFLYLQYYVFRLRYLYKMKGGSKLIYLTKVWRDRISKISKTSQQANGRKAMGGKADTLQEDEENYFRRLFGINYRLFQLYIPRPYPGAISLYRSEQGYKNPILDYSSNPYLGWEKVIHGEINVQVIPGDHDQIIREPFVKDLAQMLRADLDQANQKILSYFSNNMEFSNE